MSIKTFITSRILSIRHALRGWKFVIKTQMNARVHSAITLMVIILGVWLKLPMRDWAVLILTIAMVFAAEFFNTAVEAIVDLASPSQHPLAKISKDVSAGAVLVTALLAVLIGILILGLPLWEQIRFLF